MELRQIAFDSLGNSFENTGNITVYIKEAGAWEPFLVLQSNYPGQGNGGTLLLRKYFLEERMPWQTLDNWHQHRPTYYPLSHMSNWLETVYIQLFSPAMQQRILTTYIQVETGEDNPVERQLQTIPSRVFLLSEYEVGSATLNTRARAREGSPIEFFNPGRRYGNLQDRNDVMHERRIANTRYPYQGDTSPSWGGGGGNPGYSSWWLRTEMDTIARDTISAIMFDGTLGFIHAEDYTFVRPAFTLPGNTVIKRYEVESGRVVFVIPPE